MRYGKLATMNALQEYFRRTEKNPVSLARDMGVPPSTIYRHLRATSGGRVMTLRMAKKYHEAGIPWQVLHKYAEEKAKP